MNFNLYYKPGRTNIDADTLSRLPCSEQIPNEEVQAILKGCLEQPQFLWEAHACSARITEELKGHLKPSDQRTKGMEGCSVEGSSPLCHLQTIGQQDSFTQETSFQG